MSSSHQEPLSTRLSLTALVYCFLSLAVPVSSFSLGAQQLVPINPPIQTANHTGVHDVGVILDSKPFDGRELKFSWWYPAIHDCDAIPYVDAGGIQGKAVQNATLDRSAGPYPLIVFSTGLATWSDSYHFYVENLASHGYVVMSLQHDDATEAAVTNNTLALGQALLDIAANDSSDAVWLEYSDWFRSTEDGLTYRPQEIEFGIETALQSVADCSSFFHKAFDPHNIGMTGHSLGAFYTLVVGGGLPLYCDYAMTPAELNVSNPLLPEVSICAFPERKNLSSPFALHDHRIKAIVPLAPPFFIKESILSRSAAQIRTPMMIITGDDPKTESTRAPQWETYEAAAGPKYWVEVLGTNHLLVAEDYLFNPGVGLNKTEFQANFTDKAEVYMEYSAAFFDRYLKHEDCKTQDTLHDPISSFVAQLEYDD